jgi:hypothetical protein
VNDAAPFLTLGAILFLILALLVVLWHCETRIRQRTDAEIRERMQRGDGTADRSDR